MVQSGTRTAAHMLSRSGQPTLNSGEAVDTLASSTGISVSLPNDRCVSRAAWAACEHNRTCGAARGCGAQPIADRAVHAAYQHSAGERAHLPATGHTGITHAPQHGTAGDCWHPVCAPSRRREPRGCRAAPCRPHGNRGRHGSHTNVLALRAAVQGGTTRFLRCERAICPQGHG